MVYNHFGSAVTSAILLDTSSTKQTTLSPACTREKVGGVPQTLFPQDVGKDIGKVTSKEFDEHIIH